MKATKRCRFVMVGSGRVASHLAPALVKGGATCLGVYSRTSAHAQALAEQIGAEAIEDLAQFIREHGDELDLVLLSISDDAISELASFFNEVKGAVVLHTSGSTPMEVLSQSQYYGVLYPMQTFSKERALNMSEVPFFIEASDCNVYQFVHDIATHFIGAKSVTPLSSEDRARLHMASVFACNFVNHMWAVADEVLSDVDLDFSLLRPLIQETVEKAFRFPPKEVQTGPALRGDQKTMQRHIALLSDRPQLAELYKIISKSINDLNRCN